VREGTVRAAARTQESVAVSADGDVWFLLNASPEVRQQIESFPALHPRDLRHSPISGIVLTNGDLDHCLGLLSLRESQPLTVYATGAVRRGFTEGNVLYRTLERFAEQVSWRSLELGREQPLLGPGGRPSGLTVQALPVPGVRPLHLGGGSSHPEDNVGLRIRSERIALAYAPGAGAVTDEVRALLEGASCVFFDGTFFRSDELAELHAGARSAEEMGHLPVGGARGSLAQLPPRAGARRIYIHINNSNPILREDSPERLEVIAAGWEVAHDGMEMAL
jgi:pyrroloquinoline quinone biosynthesis protein B